MDNTTTTTATKNLKTNTTHVELTLLDLWSYNNNNNNNHETRDHQDHAAAMTMRLVDSILSQFTICCNAVAHALQQQDQSMVMMVQEEEEEEDSSLDNITVRQAIRHDIERFVKPTDKLLALGSILLKNRAYWKQQSQITTTTRRRHANVNNNNNSKNTNNNSVNKNDSTTTRTTTRTLVRLPRTAHQKPYLPMSRASARQESDDSLEENDKDDGALSVSHQFPWVGAALRLHNNNNNTSSQEYDKKEMALPSPLLRIGCDLVVQEEALNTRLYATWYDFVQVFAESFEAREWKIVTSLSNDVDQLREFLLRWAVKEAYTKALGVGLGFDFASFVVQFDQDDNFKGEPLSAYLTSATATRQPQQPILLRGKVMEINSSSSTTTHETRWDFYFVQPSRDPWSWACVAVGPIEAESSSRVKLHIRWTTLDQLVPPARKEEKDL